MTTSIGINIAKNNLLARRLHGLGMMPKLISEFVPGTSKLIRIFGASDPKLLFSRGFSNSWTNSFDGFKMSNVLFKIYGAVSDDPSLTRGLNVSYIATAWEVATIQYPELIDRQICDISRFTYLLKKVVSNEYLVCECQSKNCCNKFIIHERAARSFCWACVENYSAISLNQQNEINKFDSGVAKMPLYTSDVKTTERFNSDVFLKASKAMLFSKSMATEHNDYQADEKLVSNG
jgi:hypothetical protein